MCALGHFDVYSMYPDSSFTSLLFSRFASPASADAVLVFRGEQVGGRRVVASVGAGQKPRDLHIWCKQKRPSPSGSGIRL